MKASYQLCIQNLTERDWQLKDAQLGDALKRLDPTSTRPYPHGNVSKYYNGIIRAIRGVFHEEFRRPKRPEERDPLESCLQRNIRHPEMEYLLAAIEQGDDYHVKKLMRRISADGWKNFLRNVNRRDTRAFFAYLAKMEGRKECGFVPADTTPLLDDKGCEVVANRDKVSLLTETFRRKFAAPIVNNPALPATEPNHCPLPPFRERIQDQFTPVRLIKVRKAINQLSSNKAPGPGGIPVELYKNLPSCLPYLPRLVNEMYRSGFTPHKLRAILMVANSPTSVTGAPNNT